MATWIEADGRLTREFRFADFASAMAFANEVAALADREDHHPDLHVSWGRLRIEWWTHTAGGVTPRDHACASAVDALWAARG